MGSGRTAAGRRGQARAVRTLSAILGHYLFRSDEIAEGEARAFPPPGRSRPKLFVVRRHCALFAYWDACPHYGDTPMAWRTNQYLNAARDRIVCASHGAEFDIETGRCVLGAALGKSLTSAPIETTAAGEVFLASDCFGGE
jgi:nitrite reductase/ring-hydroxylating ferredoxin subunit